MDVNGVQRHIMSYMQDFLFEPSRARAPITALSGGETGRLMLAKLFLKPSNLIVLDEPSNDLDIETLELLETLLADYKGTVILISHDRQLIENVVTRSLIYQGQGEFIEVAGGYEDFERERASSASLKPVFAPNTTLQTPTKKNTNSKNKQRKPNKTANKLSFTESKELTELPNRINKLEQELTKIHENMNQAGFYEDSKAAEKVVSSANAIQHQLDEAYIRWETLESRSNA